MPNKISKEFMNIMQKLAYKGCLFLLPDARVRKAIVTSELVYGEGATLMF
jgi:hypothetical protein